MPISPVGSTPHFGNLYVMAWTLFNFAVMIGIVVLVIWYVKQKHDFRKQLLNKLDTMISLLKDKK